MRTFRTNHQLETTRRLAAEGVSAARVAKVIGLNINQVRSMARVYKFKFKGKGGGQYGNQNRKGYRIKPIRTIEEIRTYNREKQKRHRERTKSQGVRIQLSLKSFQPRDVLGRFTKISDAH